MIPVVLFGSVELPARLQVVPSWLTPVTSQFLHGDLLHLLGNMVYLWVFGRGVEAAMGPIRYLLLYIASGVVAALTQAFVDPTGANPHDWGELFEADLKDNHYRAWNRMSSGS